MTDKPFKAAPQYPENQEKADHAHYGSMLKEVREAKGIPLRTVHEETKIPMDALRAIEEGYSVGTLTPFYVKGFIKIYSKYLDVDVSKVLENAPQEEKPATLGGPVEEQPPIQEFDLKQWLAAMFNLRRRQQIAGILGALFIFFLLFKILTFVLHKFSGGTSKHKRIRVERVEIKKKKKKSVRVPVIRTTTRSVPVVTAAQPSVVVASPKVRKNVTLTARAKKSSWLSVKSDGEVVFQSTLRRGAFETWSANEKIEISGRNLNQLEFELNGKVIGSLGRKDRKAKRIIIRKEGLSVVK